MPWSGETRTRVLIDSLGAKSKVSDPDNRTFGHHSCEGAFSRDRSSSCGGSLPSGAGCLKDRYLEDQRLTPESQAPVLAHCLSCGGEGGIAFAPVALSYQHAAARLRWSNPPTFVSPKRLQRRSCLNRVIATPSSAVTRLRRTVALGTWFVAKNPFLDKLLKNKLLRWTPVP